MINSSPAFRVPHAAPWRLSPRLSLIVNVMGVLLLVSAPFWLHELFGVYEEELPISLFVSGSAVALVLAANYVLILHCSRRHASLRRLMAVGLLAKMAAAGLYVTMVVRVYSYSADMSHYFYVAQGMATNYAQTGVLTIPTPLFGTEFPPFLAQCIFIVTGISLPVAMVFFASMSFWGAYFLYRAFSIGYPDATRFDIVATLAFLMPSCVFWTASIGKDAVVMLGAGIAAYGFARVHHHGGLPGYALLAAGLTIIMTVRPHMAGILAIAFIFPHLFGANRTGLSGLALKIVGIPALVGLTALLVTRAQTYVEMRDFSGGKAVVMQVARSNAEAGGSSYGGTLAARMALAPFLLIRPFPFEVRNLQAAVASLEGLGLLVLFVRRRRVVYATLSRLRSNPFAMFLVLYTVEFTIIFAAATTNFGLLNRQRVMLLPFTLMLFLGDSRSAPFAVSKPTRVLRLRRRSPLATNPSGLQTPTAGD